MNKLSILGLLISVISAQFSIAQEVTIEDPTLSGKLPLNQEVISGKFDNGLTYYILPNQKPKNKVELRLVVNAGSALENDDQQGLAHFCEHMAFNGTEHFKKNELVDYLQSAGVKFGAHLNAYTSFDETVYMLSLPSDDEALLDKGFLVLEDWSSNLVFDPEEINKERGVVLEEFRLGLGAQKRMMENYLPVVFKESRYAERLPIGKKDILENFEPETLVNFYRSWYRPDLMSVIVVGDIDAQHAERKIEEHFKKLVNPPDPKPRELFKIPDHDGIDISINSDKEAVYNNIQFFLKIRGDREVLGTESQFMKGVESRILYSIINERLDDIGESPSSPFSYVWINEGEMWARTKSAIQAGAVVNNGKYLECLDVILSELRRVEMHGVSLQEFTRAKTKVLKSAERRLKEKGKIESRRLAGALADHFLTGKPMVSAEQNLELVRKAIENIDHMALNQRLRGLAIETNGAVVITGTESDKGNMPNEEQILKKIIEISRADVAPKNEEHVATSLMVEFGGQGQVMDENSITEIEANVVIFENGAKVIMKRTELKNDQILFYAFSPGGSSIYDDATYKKIKYAMSAISVGGVGEHSRKDVSKILAGKKVSVNPFISSRYEGLNGNCSPEDIESLFQLAHLYINNPRIDEEAYANKVIKDRSVMDNMLSNPGSYFNQEFNKFMLNNHLRMWQVPNEQDWKNTSYKEMMKVYKDRFNSTADFTYIFVGNIEEGDIVELASRYFGSSPKTNRVEKFVDRNLRPISGTDRLNVYKGSESQSQVRIIYKGETTYNQKDDLLIGMLGEALSIKLTEKLREEMSGVYGSRASGYLALLPYENFTFTVSFPCGPENVDALIDATKAEIKSLIDNGPEEKDLNKVIQARVKDLDTKKQSNRYWMAKIQSMELYDMTAKEVLDDPEEIKAVTAKDLQEAAKKFLSGDNLIGVLYPESEKK